ncbi:unnamed protein product [Mycena citricolor]|uniref:Sec20 C-terminal domain-containing protein n=1 Tax=Mycena citricolor TaxID=2018698 RepID=A0AAD2HCT4_9AGAR|nr:unnamed protein product [Mycena citricolor]
MPPLPLKFDEETLKLLDAVERHAKDIEDFQIPRLRSCEGPFAVQQTLASELREDVDALARQVEALDVLVDDQRGASNKRGLRTIVEELSERLNAIRRESRAALLASKRTLDSLSTSRRDELLGSASVSEKQGSNGRFAEDALMAASDKVTDAMQRTMELMDAELKRSVLVSQTLADSTATLKSTSLTHDTLTTVLDTSKHLVTALEKADTLDRLLIGAALVLFILVVLFILKQRIFDRGMRVAFWWTRFLPDFSGDGDLLNVGRELGLLKSFPARWPPPHLRF